MSRQPALDLSHPPFSVRWINISPVSFIIHCCRLTVRWCWPLRGVTQGLEWRNLSFTVSEPFLESLAPGEVHLFSILTNKRQSKHEQGRRLNKRGVGTSSCSFCCSRPSSHPSPSPSGVTCLLDDSKSYLGSSPVPFFSVLALTCRQFSLGELLPPQLPRPPTHGHARPQQLEGLDLEAILISIKDLKVAFCQSGYR